MKPEKILEIADKNGFDWFGEGKALSSTMDIEQQGGTLITHLKYVAKQKPNDYRGRWRAISLADLATNKSFLEALLKASGKEIAPTKVQMLTGEEWDLTYERIQLRLVRDLTNNNGKDFWKICSDFIGETK